MADGILGISVGRVSWQYFYRINLNQVTMDMNKESLRSIHGISLQLLHPLHEFPSSLSICLARLDQRINIPLLPHSLLNRRLGHQINHIHEIMSPQSILSSPSLPLPFF